MKDAVKRKIRRIRHREQQELSTNLPLFKRKLYRLYSYKGRKKCKWTVKVSRLVLDTTTNEYRWKTFEKTQKYRGNYLSYAFRASEIFQEPAIKRQVRRHWQVLQQIIKKNKL